MTSARQTPELQEKKAEQVAGQSDSVLGSQAITKPDDNRIFLVDKSPATGVRSLDLGKVDIYQSQPGNDHAFGPDLRPKLLEDKTKKEVKAFVELSFDNFDKISLTSAEQLDFNSNRVIDTSKLTPQKLGNTGADAKLERSLPEKDLLDKALPSKDTAEKVKSEKPVIDEYIVKPGDSVARIAKQLAGKDGSPQDTERIIKEIVQLNGWKDASHPLHPGDRVKVPGDKAADAKPEDQKLQDAKEKLTKQAEEKFKDDPAKLAQFKENMRLLEDRAEKDKLSPTEIAKTYKEIDRLLEAKGDKPLKPDQRKDLAEQIIRQAAAPTTIDQGAHKTCSMATVETRMYTRNPSDAARLVTDVALTGQYVATDGRRVRVNPSAHNESRNSTTNDGDRSHASEIFQVTGVNLHIDQENRKTNPRGQLRYEQHPTQPGSGDSGERIIDYSSKPPRVIENDPKIYRENLGNLRDVYSAITGKKEEGIAIAHDSENVDKSDGVIRVTSEQHLNDALAQAKKDGKMPLIVAIDATIEPFWTDSGSGAAGGSGGGHVATITDYTPGPPAKVTIDNQWGKPADHDAARPLSVHDLYQSIKGKSHVIAELEKDVTAAKDAGHPDTYKELDLARLKFQAGESTLDDFEKEVIRLIKEVAEMPDDDNKKRSTEKLRSTMDTVQLAAIMKILREEKKASTRKGTSPLDDWHL
jgi:LysM repeat protein